MLKLVGEDILIPEICGIQEERCFFTGEVNSPGVVVSCLCLWLGLVGTGLELVKVRQLFPVVVLVLIGVVMVGAHNVISYVGLRLLRPRGSELERGKET